MKNIAIVSNKYNKENILTLNRLIKENIIVSTNIETRGTKLIFKYFFKIIT